MATQVVPEVLDGVQLRAVRRQRDRRDVVRHLQIDAAMIARTVPDQHHVYILVDLFAHLTQEAVDHAGIDRRGQQPGGLARRRASGPEDVEVVVLGLLDRRRARAGACPLAGERALLAEAGLVLEPRLDTFAGVLGLDRLDLRYDVFLNAACASGSCFG